MWKGEQKGLQGYTEEFDFGKKYFFEIYYTSNQNYTC